MAIEHKNTRDVSLLKESNQVIKEYDPNGFKFPTVSKRLEKLSNSVDNFWGIQLEYNATYKVPGISSKAKYNQCKKEFPDVRFWNCRLTKELGSVTYNNALTQSKNWRTKYEAHKETFYSQKVLPWTWLEKYCWLTWRHTAEDWTVRDGDWYIVVACNYLPRFSTIMTTLWPWKVYDTWEMTGNHIDIYVDR